MKDYAIDKGLVKEIETSSKKLDYGKRFFGFRKMYWDYLNKLNVPFFDICCELAPTSPKPVRFNATTGSLEYYNGTVWVEAGSGSGASATGITAFAGGGQASATALTVGYNEVTVVATAGDSVKLPSASVSSVVIVKNEGATAMDVFPFLADTINDAAANAAIRVAPGSTVVFSAVDSTNWEASNQILAAGNGTAALPSLTFSTQPNMGLYRVSATQLGVTTPAGLTAVFDIVGLKVDNIGEVVGNAGVTVDSMLIKDGGLVAVKGDITQITSNVTGVTSNAPAGTITTVALTTAAASGFSFTLTNSFITTTSVVLVTSNMNSGNGTANISVTPALGSAVVTVSNAGETGAAAFNAALKIMFMVV